MIVQHRRIHIRNDPTGQKRRFGDSRGKGGGKRKGKRGGKGKFRPFVNHKQRNPFGFAGLYAEDDDEGCAAYLGAEDEEDDPYNDPAHWYAEEDEGETAEPESGTLTGKNIQSTVNGRTSQHTSQTSGPRNTTSKPQQRQHSKQQNSSV